MHAELDARSTRGEELPDYGSLLDHDGHGRRWFSGANGCCGPSFHSFLESRGSSFDELKALQEKLIQSEKLASLGRLVGGAAHEMNNPLTAMLGYSDLLSASNLPRRRTAPSRANRRTGPPHQHAGGESADFCQPGPGQAGRRRHQLGAANRGSSAGSPTGSAGHRPLVSNWHHRCRRCSPTPIRFSTSACTLPVRSQRSSTRDTLRFAHSHAPYGRLGSG